MANRAARPIDDHEPALIAPRDWLLRDELWRKMEVEVRRAHVCDWWLAVGGWQ
jgi:hypothetical protein